MSVNLLPKQYKPSRGALKIIKYTKNATSLALGILVLAVVGIAVAYFINNTSISRAEIANQGLKQKVESLQKTEKSLFLVKDRLTKISSIRSTTNLDPNIDLSVKLVSFIPDDISFDSLEVDTDTITFGVSSPSSTDMSNFISNLQNSNMFTSVKMESFSFNESVGFIASFVITK